LIAPSEPSVEGNGRYAAIYDSDRGDGRGVYCDGVYSAAPVLGPQLPTPSVGAPNFACNGDRDGESVLYYKPWQAFTRRLLALFKKQRRQLAVTPIKGLKKLPKAMKLTLPKGYKVGYMAYKDMTINHNPLPVYLAALSQNTLLRMLGYATEGLKRNRNIGSRQAAWLWGLLCRLGDVGTMDSDAISVIRDLGKKAVWVGLGFFDEEAAKLTAEYSGLGARSTGDPADFSDEEWDESGSEDMDLASSRGSADCDIVHVERGELEQRRRRNTSSPPSSDDGRASPPGRNANYPSAAQVETSDLEAARARLLERIETDDSADAHAEACDDDEKLVENPNDDAVDDRNHHQAEEHTEERTTTDCPDGNTRATLDMIITISGEVYGQRDLLEFREVWGGESGLWG
jgi:hypothetical protein